ncbi:hypothetical protein LPJ78_004662 [Coemansia sp. RSA 989]|nr:hypothetical protein BX667DRAFT_508412 [Coemansia mojavensis]KAJ1739724.1 hypothetical protein LPJ68_004438 [Coemansia sp. RSA 1086]KAJ1748097.1 hypothetical protein LPJ79_004783 [Coemansia sp. RSA 1821]KAJ1862512.1 hypothetical protein LPJ78_004662 [Coemansia sp. RSA 989]KAJ1870111.1 hypothetical protein LPJ55_004889 [Coemansia sp. RSA 990]
MDIHKLITLSQPCTTFPQALYKILSEGHTWIEWSKDGTKLRYNDPERLMRELQALGFKAQDAASLSKNFNDYGFKRLSDARKSRYDPWRSNWTIFTHQNFVRHNSESASSIQRRRARRPRSAIKKDSPVSDDAFW